MKNKWFGLFGIVAIAFLAGANGDGCNPAPGQGEACGQGDTCATGLTCLHYYGVAGPAGPEFKTCEIPCTDGGECPDGQACVTIADGPGRVCQPTDEQSCDPFAEKSCGDDMVCVVEEGETSGTCKPFAHGQTVGEGYSCGGSIGVSCADGLYCKGMPHGQVIGGTGTCTNMTCDDWHEEMNDWTDDINHCTSPSDCISVDGTSCGCRDAVVNKNEDIHALQNFIHDMNENGCGFTSVCDCYPSSGLECVNGKCQWHYNIGGSFNP